MDPLKPLLATAQSWVHRNLLLLLIAAAVLTDLGFIVYAHYNGRAGQLQRGAPAQLNFRQIAQLKREAARLARQQAQSQRRADSAYARAQAPEQDAARRQLIITHLTIRYHALATDTATPAAAADYLRHYRPGPDADL